jgi:gas vesicle protein
MEENMRKFGKFVLGAFIGGLVGSSLALLFAPTSGENARQEIEDYFKHIKDEVNRAADEKRAELVAELETLRSGK